VIPAISGLLVKGFFWRDNARRPRARDRRGGLRAMGNDVSVGTVLLVALLLIAGSQFTLFAMWFDMESNKDLR
jgi:hypothetical protein